MHAFFSIFRTLPGIEPGHPRTLFPDDVIRDTIGHVGSTIYVVNDVLFIYHSLLTLHIYAIYIQGSRRITDTLGPTILSFIQRLSSSRLSAHNHPLNN